MDADEPMEKDCCILSQDFFCTPDYITIPQVAYDSDDVKENIPLAQIFGEVSKSSEQEAAPYLTSNLEDDLRMEFLVNSVPR